jgi:hypothetical protein
MKRHYAPNCPKVIRRCDRKYSGQEKSGYWNRLWEGSRPSSPVREVGCVNAYQDEDTVAVYSSLGVTDLGYTLERY